MLALFAWVNIGRVEARGAVWRDQAEPFRAFLTSIKKEMPDFPPNSHVTIINGPVGRSYVQQSLRASYKRTDISWIYNPEEFTRKPGESAFLILCNWVGEGVVLEVYPI